MARFRMFLAALCCITAISSVAIAEETTVVQHEDGGKGMFEYPWSGGNNNEFVLWGDPNENGGMVGIISGAITPETVIHAMNVTSFDRDSHLMLVSGKRVVLYARVRVEGEGEASQRYAEEIWFFVPPDRR